MAGCQLRLRGYITILYVAMASACSGKTAVSCPVAAPSAGAACDAPTLECEYGDDLLIKCNTVARCDANGWTLTAPQQEGCPTPPPGASCPSSYVQISSGSICDSAQSCVYAEATCACGPHCGTASSIPVACEAGTAFTWQCSAPAAGCPSVRPRLGAACAVDGLDCSYDGCGETAFRCTAGVWHSFLPVCPL